MSQAVALEEQVQEGPTTPKYGALDTPVVAEEEEPSCGQEEHTPTPALSPQYIAPVSDKKPVSDRKRPERADDARDWQEEARFRREEEEAGLQPEEQEDAEVFDKEESPSPPLKKQSTVIDEKLHVCVE
jgi:hypothetical protein